MAEIKDRDVKKWIRDFKKKVNAEYDPEKIILFGRRARDDHLIESDVDMIIVSDKLVSDKFKDVKWPVRIGDVAEMWDGLVDIEPLCYTPEEFDKKKKQIGIVRQAVKEGIVISG